MPHDDETFGAQWWEDHYADTEPGPAGTPSPYLAEALDGLRPGTVLDAGCGTGGDALWLAQHGWDVTAVDVSPTAIRHAHRSAAEVDPAAAERISWLASDLMSWDPPQRFDAVVSQYVHPDAPFDAFVHRLASAVVPGGTLLVVGHDHRDSHASAHAPHDASIGTAAVTSALDPAEWEIATAETRVRRVPRAGSHVELVDTVVSAHRRRTPGLPQ